MKPPKVSAAMRRDLQARAASQARGEQERLDRYTAEMRVALGLPKEGENADGRGDGTD